jgi:hypothetical protein
MKTRVFYDIGYDDREDILKNAPDYIQEGGTELVESYIQYEYARRMLDQHPDRWYTFRNKLKERQTVDLKNKSIRSIILSKYGTEQDVDDAIAIQDSVLSKLIEDLGEKKASLQKAIREQKNRGAAIGIYTERLLELFGKFNPVEEIIKIIKAETGTELGITELTQFYNSNKAIIEKRKEEYLHSSNQYKIATDAGRLEILNTLLTDMLLKYKDRLEQGKDALVKVYSQEVRAILEQARKEVKGNELKLTVDGKIDITATLHGVENTDRIMRCVPINSIVIGLVAAKVGLNPTVIISQLATSYYKDFNGFNQMILGKDNIQLPGDYIRTYDWDDLREKNKKFLGEMSTPIEEASYEEVEIADKKKSEILERIRRITKKG